MSVEDTSMKERVDNYARAKAKLRSSTKQEAMRRLWAMAQEALATRARLGVAALSYSSDLVPGTERVLVEANEREVTLTVTVTDGSWVGKGEDGGGDDEEGTRRVYVIDEAWLLGVAT